jgi:hypothetical protein
MEATRGRGNVHAGAARHRGRARRQRLQRGQRIFITANGPTGEGNPQRQGLSSALLAEGRGPLNVLGGIPTVATDYSPLWDINLGEWTDEAIANGYRSRVIEEFQILGLVEQGWITGPAGAEYGSIGVIVNCPIVWRFL